MVGGLVLGSGASERDLVQGLRPDPAVGYRAVPPCNGVPMDCIVDAAVSNVDRALGFFWVGFAEEYR